MALELFEDSLNDARNAVFLAAASDLAYANEKEGVPAFREQLGLEARLISQGNTQAWVGHNDDHIVVAFRGTEAPTSIEGLKDWFLSDALNLLVIPEGRMGTDFAAAGVGARFHLGFMNAITDIWGPLLEEVQAQLKAKERPLWVTGHSLGGALALLSSWLFQRKFISVHQVYTYGAPMIGNRIASEAFDREFPDKIYRYVNFDDPVPKLPTMSLVANDYGHCNKEVPLGSEDSGGILGLFKTVANKTADGGLNSNIVSELWNGIQSQVAAHGLDIYRKLIGTITSR